MWNNLFPIFLNYVGAIHNKCLQFPLSNAHIFFGLKIMLQVNNCEEGQVLVRILQQIDSIS